MKSFSEKVIYALLQISAFEKIPAYCPTSSHNDEEILQFYDDLDAAKKAGKATRTFIVGDFNCKIGRAKSGETKIGQFGIGKRNKRGDTLINFCEQNNMFIMNSFFKKKPHRKWTWRSPDGKTKNEIDFVLATEREMVHDVSVLNQVSFSSDHRLVRAKIKLRTRIQIINKQNSKTKYDIGALRHDPDKNEQFTRTLHNTILEKCELSEQNLNEIEENFVNSTIRAAEEILGPKSKCKQTKMSSPTKQLIKERKIQMRKGADVKVLNEMSKNIKKKIRKDIRTYNTNCINDTIERNRGPKIFQKQISWKKNEIYKLKSVNGQILTNKKEIISTIKSFYQQLYNNQIMEEQLNGDKRAILTRHITEDLPLITKAEIKMQ